MNPLQKEQLIDKIARYIVENDLGLPADILLEVYKPMAWTMTNMGLFYLGPFLGISSELEKIGGDLTELFAHEENWNLILKRIHELKAEKELMKEQMSTEQDKTLFGRIKRFLWGTG